jgi:hypothetical protein
VQSGNDCRAGVAAAIHEATPPGKACCQLLMEKRLIRIWRGGAGDTAAGIIEAIDHVWRQLTKTDEVQLRRIAASN